MNGDRITTRWKIVKIINYRWTMSDG